MKPTPNQIVVVTAGACKGETGTVQAKTGAGWQVRLASGKVVTLAASSLKRGVA